MKIDVKFAGLLAVGAVATSAVVVLATQGGGKGKEAAESDPFLGTGKAAPAGTGNGAGTGAGAGSGSGSGASGTTAPVVSDDGFQAPTWLVVVLAGLGIAGVLSLLFLGRRTATEEVPA